MDQPTVKTAASKLRALLMLGKLRPEQVSRLRTAGMLPSRQQYASGFRRGLQEVLQKAYARSDAAFEGGIAVNSVHRDIASALQKYKLLPDGTRSLFGGTNVLDLPHTLRLGAPGGKYVFDTSKMPLRDVLTALHEVLEHRGLMRNGGHPAYTAPMTAYITSLGHNPGVLRGERKAYEHLIGQLTGRKPNWLNYRVSTGGQTRALIPDEAARSTLRWRDERALMRLASALEHKYIPGSVIPARWHDIIGQGSTLNPTGRNAVSRLAVDSAIALARSRGNKKVVDYLNAYKQTLSGSFGESGVFIPNANAIRTNGARQLESPAAVWDTYIRAGRR